MDEVLTLGNRLKTRDLQNGSVILDFRDLQVVKASLDGNTVPKDFERVVAFYRQHYAHVIDRLFRENGYEVSAQEPSTEPSTEPQPG
jgi:hypothetical protein